MPRPKIFGYIAVAVSLILTALFFYYAFNSNFCAVSFDGISSEAYYAIAVPIGAVAIAILCTGLWIGWTILIIKVAPPMPEIVEKKDFAKIKAFVLCVVTLTLACLFVYGVYIKSYMALAIPAAVITLVLLGMVFWVGYAIITTRATLPAEKKN